MRGKQIVNQISLIFIFAFIGIYGDIQWYQKGNDASLFIMGMALFGTSYAIVLIVDPIVGWLKKKLSAK